MGETHLIGRIRNGLGAIVIGFVMTVVAIVIVYNCVHRNLRETKRTELEKISDVSRLMSRGIDASKVQRIRDHADTNKASYREFVDNLQNLRRSVSGMVECYVLRLNNDGAKVLADTGRTNADNSSTTPERYDAFDDYSPVPSEAIIAGLTGRIQIESQTRYVFGETVRRAYAPILDSNRTPIAVLVLSFVSSDDGTTPWTVWLDNLPITVGLLVMMSTIGWICLAHFRYQSEHSRSSGSLRPRIVKWIIADVLFIFLAVFTVLSVRTFFVAQEDATNAIVSSQSREIALRHSISASATVRDSVQSQIHQEQILQADMRERLNLLNSGILVGFMMMGGLAIGALLALRIALRTHLSLQEAQEDAEWHRSQHEQLVEGLPIGFYATESAEIVFSNSAMDALTSRDGSESAQEAFAKSLHPEDAEEVFNMLKSAELSGNAFDFTFRLGQTDTNARYIETRGVPIFDADGVPSRTVAFAMDVTGQRRAQNLAERRQHEAEEANRMLRKALEDGEANFEATVCALVKAVEAKDVYTAGHSERVMDYSVRIGRALGLNDSQLRTLRMGTLIHDVGKIGIPDSILSKPDRLTQEEFALIRQHPEIGVRMIGDIPAFRDCIPIVLYHHERLDGRGYPFGLTAESIPLLVRISTVADCFDAMTSDRAYRKDRSAVQALGDLAVDAEKGSIDGKIVETLADIVLNGDILRLNRAA